MSSSNRSPSLPAIQLARHQLGSGREYLVYETNCPRCSQSIGFRLDQVACGIELNGHGPDPESGAVTCDLSHTLLPKPETTEVKA